MGSETSHGPQAAELPSEIVGAGPTGDGGRDEVLETACDVDKLASRIKQAIREEGQELRRRKQREEEEEREKGIKEAPVH